MWLFQQKEQNVENVPEHIMIKKLGRFKNIIFFMSVNTTCQSKGILLQ